MATMPDILRELRQSKSMTQSGVAEILGLTTNAYQSYERGTSEPSCKALNTLANFYGVTTDYLLGREKAPDPFGDLDLSAEDEQEVFRKYMSLPENVRAIMLDVLLQLGEAARARQAAEQENECIYKATTAGEAHDRLEAQANAEEDAG